MGNIAIDGPAGAGKSTILKCISGLLKPQSGSIIIDNQDILKFDRKKLDVIRHKIGMVFQSGALFNNLNVVENVAYGLVSQGKNKSDAIKIASDERLTRQLINAYSAYEA